MFDIHSHIIYGVDDGARTPEEALDLIRMDMQMGVTDIIATPHYYVNHPSDPDRILRRLEHLREMLRAEGSATVRLYPGNEVLWFESMTEKLKSGEILTLGGSRFTLIEFYPEESWETIRRAVRKVRDAGYRPVIAHAERFIALHKRDRLPELIDLGAYIQLSTQPFSGGFFDPIAKFCKAAVKAGDVHFLGTDMHRTDRRPPEWNAAVKYIENKSDRPEALFRKNAERMLKDQDFLWN
ncbi:MAG: protein tyrosine phosphatase [Lachnospiraceae bacterium]|nr:protein tyrosine phosphatase [Lachnospiraceae bacterium]